MSLEYDHIPVMLEEVNQILHPYEKGLYIDCTFGAGGYTKNILKNKEVSVISIDRDENIKIFSKEILKKNSNRFKLIIDKFSNLEEILKKETNPPTAIIFDLGVSSLQIDNPERGFSYKNHGLLKMTMGNNNINAFDIVNKCSQERLRDIFWFFGEEREANLIAKLIVQKREDKEIETTKELAEIILRAKRYKNKQSKKDCCAKVFQAIRMVVNQELTEIYKGLISAINVLSKNGKIIVVTFHSIEDKLVKKIFDYFSNQKKGVSRYLPESENKKNSNIIKLINKKVLIPSKKELEKNNRSRSAKLRSVIKINDINFKIDRSFLNFEKFFEIEENCYA
jgi:16S rRNA (cytosine1402-N4)-methyltransferase